VELAMIPEEVIMYVSPIPLDAFAELVWGEKILDLGEDGLYGVHERNPPRGREELAISAKPN
jgi:hypothetical protein